jgi:Na+/proline symporter
MLNGLNIPLAATGMAVYLPIAMIGVYLVVVLYIGIFAFRKGKATGEDFFLASRSVGPIVFFLSLFATNMTSVAILGSSGAAFKQGIGIFGMMATISAFIIPLSLFVIGTRLWSLGKRFGHMTQVAFFRDRWECSTIGTIMFGLMATMLLPYLIVSIIGGGTILETLSHGIIPYWMGGAIVALVVMGNVFFGGMRGAVLVNVFQTLLFLSFGAIAFAVIGGHLDGGFAKAVDDIVNKNPTVKQLMTRERIPPYLFLSYCFIPLSSIMFPHMAIMCFTAKKVTAFKKTVILYPLCIMAIWLPCVFLGALGPGQPNVSSAVVANTEEIKPWIEGQVPVDKEPGLAKALAKAKPPTAEAIAAARKAGHELENPNELYADVTSGKVRDTETFATRLANVKDPTIDGAKAGVARNPKNSTDSVLLHMLDYNAPWWLAGLLAAGIISAVMGSDCHQILALSTMFSKDIFEYYGGKKKVGEKTTVFVGRAFILIANTIAFVIALARPPIFEIAVRYAFAGFASLAPVMLAALFWRRSTKYGALAATLWVAFCLTMQAILEITHIKQVVPGVSGVMIWSIDNRPILWLNKVGSLSCFGSFTNNNGYMPVVPMVIGASVCVVLGSLLTKPPSRATIEKYFSTSATKEPTGQPVGSAA